MALNIAAAAATSSTCWHPPTPPDQLDALLAPAGYHVVRPLECRPLGADSVDEYTLRAFWREHCAGWVAPEALDDWWVADHYKNPTWDLIAVCERDSRRGLLLVEAKAHESELDWKGKRALAAETDSAQAWVNDAQHPSRYRRSAGLVRTGRRSDDADGRQPLPAREPARLRVQGGQRRRTRGPAVPRVHGRHVLRGSPS